MRLRAFTSWLITWGFIILTWSGIVLFFTPKGRFAHWTDWKFMGLTKSEYENIHVTFMVLFVVGVLFHIYFNWKPLINYMKNKKREVTFSNKNFLLSFLVSVVFIAGTLALTPPFSYFLDFQERLELSWESDLLSPPYGHAELSSLKVLSSRMGWDEEKVLNIYKKSGFIEGNINDDLKTLATLNNTTPSFMFDTIAKGLNSGTTSGGGGGFGKLTLEEASVAEGFSYQEAIKYLNSKGVVATKDSSLKELAEKLDLKPRDLANELKRR